jgi:hypothetical protein
VCVCVCVCVFVCLFVCLILVSGVGVWMLMLPPWDSDGLDSGSEFGIWF